MKPLGGQIKHGKSRDRPRKYTMFGARLRQYRVNTWINGHRMKQIEMARKLGVSHSTYFRWETGRQFPDPPHMDKIIRMTGMDGDLMWLDCYILPPDMHLFLTTTREGETVVKNIRKVMNQLDLNQKPTTRRNLDPEHDPIRESSQHNSQAPPVVLRKEYAERVRD